MTTSIRCLIAAMVAAFVPLHAHAQTVADWSPASGSGPYHNDNSWSIGGQSTGALGAVPDSATESARFGLTSSYSVELARGSSTTAADIEFLSPTTVTLKFDATSPGTGDAKLTAADHLLIDQTRLQLRTNGGQPGSSLELAAEHLTLSAGGQVNTIAGTRVSASSTTIEHGRAGVPSSLQLWSLGTHTLGEVSIGEVGDSGREGELSITGNANVKTEGLSIANGANMRGVLSLLDATLQQLGDAELTLGADAATGEATAFVGDGGQLDTATGGATIHTTGALRNNGGEVLFDGDLTVAGGLYTEQGAATRGFATNSQIAVRSGGRMNLGSQSLSLTDTQTLAVSGAGSKVTGLGDLSLGGMASLEIALPSTSLATAPIRFNGVADLLGPLSVSLEAGVSPELGESLPLVEASVFSNLPSLASAPALSSGLDWDLQVVGDELHLVVIEAPTPPGDYNGDGLINAADYAIARDSAATPLEDLTLWRANFGSTNPAVNSAAHTVPEPSLLALVAGVVLASGLYSPQRRR